MPRIARQSIGQHLVKLVPANETLGYPEKDKKLKVPIAAYGRQARR